MKLTIKHGRITGIGEQELNPILPKSDLSFITDKDLYREIRNYVKSEHGNIERQLTFEEGVMKQSNPYLAVVVDMFFKNEEFALDTGRNAFKLLTANRGAVEKTITAVDVVIGNALLHSRDESFG